MHLLINFLRNLTAKGNVLVGRINDLTCAQLMTTIVRREIRSFNTGIELDEERWELGTECRLGWV